LSTKIFLTIFFVALISTNIVAQTPKGIVPAEFFPLQKGMTAHFNFTGLLDAFDQNISIGGEYRFAEHWSAGSDVAYVFASAYFSESKSSHGFILRPFIRYYPGKSRYGFFEAGLHYKYVAYKITDWIGKDVVNGQPSYEEYSSFHYIKNAYEFNLKTGTATSLSRNKNLRMEFYAGLGFRFKTQESENGSYDRTRGWLVIYNPRYSTIVVPMGMRLVYDLK
jgi:hypothetical protein